MGTDGGLQGQAGAPWEQGMGTSSAEGTRGADDRAGMGLCLGVTGGVLEADEPMHLPPVVVYLPSAPCFSSSPTRMRT